MQRYGDKAYAHQQDAQENLSGESFYFRTNDPINRGLAIVYPGFSSALEHLQELFGREYDRGSDAIDEETPKEDNEETRDTEQEPEWPDVPPLQLEEPLSRARQRLHDPA
jgi:hypothetical protein